MDNIIEPTIDYDFSNLYLGPPTTLTGGAYFTRIMYNTNKSIYIQTPKCLTKQGFIKSGKKIYADLMFDNNDTVFINWMENLETKCQELIFSKGQSWFETKLEKEDIETAFTSPFKIFKSGKYYLLRVNVKPNLKIYDENDQIMSIDDIQADKNIISILEIQGIKFTSRNFQIEIELKQSMVVSPDPFLDECFIKKPVKKQQATYEQEERQEEKPNMISEQSSGISSFIKEAAKDLAQSIKDNTKSEPEPINLDTSFQENKDNNVATVEDEHDGLEDANIVLDVEDIDPKPEIEEKEDPYVLKEFDLNSTLETNLESITLKKPNQVYYEIYKKARDKAKEAKKNALVAYLEMKNIKKTYMLDDIDDSDSDFDDFNSEDEDEDQDEDLETNNLED